METTASVTRQVGCCWTYTRHNFSTVKNVFKSASILSILGTGFSQRVYFVIRCFFGEPTWKEYISWLLFQLRITASESLVEDDSDRESTGSPSRSNGSPDSSIITIQSHIDKSFLLHGFINIYTYQGRWKSFYCVIGELGCKETPDSLQKKRICGNTRTWRQFDLLKSSDLLWQAEPQNDYI